MWLLILMLYVANPAVDVAMTAQIGPFRTFNACNDALAAAQQTFGAQRGITVKGVCVLQ